MAQVAQSRIAYADYQSGMPVDPEVVKAMLPYFTESFGNPSSLHFGGSAPKAAVDDARKKVGDLIGADRPDEIIFTSCATESLNLAIRGAAMRLKDKGNHIITSTVEHISVVNVCKFLEKNGFKVSYLPVDKSGTIDVSKLKSELNDKTILVSVQYANPEIGTIQPVKEIGQIAREKKVLYHVDATAANGHHPVNVKDENIDLLTLSSNDMYGPKGMGALYVRKGVRIEPVILGGGQERGLRSGSENVAGIVGMGKAAELAKSRMGQEIEHCKKIRDRLIDYCTKNIVETYINGHPTNRLCNNAAMWFSAIEGEALLTELDWRKISSSTGSACSSKTLEPSHVLHALGLNEVQAHGSVVCTLSRFNKLEDADYIGSVLKDAVDRLRKLSPLWGKAMDVEKWQREATAEMERRKERVH